MEKQRISRELHYQLRLMAKAWHKLSGKFACFYPWLALPLRPVLQKIKKHDKY